MPYKLIKKHYKKTGEVWDGVYVGDITKAINTKTPDPRDNNGYSENENQSFSTHITQLKTQPGYLGFDRVYENDDRLDIIRYFDTEENMRSYYNLLINKENEPAVSVETNLKESTKFLGYIVRYEMQDLDGNIIDILTKDGTSSSKTETIVFE